MQEYGDVTVYAHNDLNPQIPQDSNQASKSNMKFKAMFGSIKSERKGGNQKLEEKERKGRKNDSPGKNQ